MWPILFGDKPDVFVSPYQDGPLDLGYPSFIQTRYDSHIENSFVVAKDNNIPFKSRKEEVFNRLLVIEEWSISEIITEIGSVYRQHYKRSCRGLSWGFPLNVLQLVAVCVGNKGLAAICKALAVNYKHFSAGAPDLLLIRITTKNGAKVHILVSVTMAITILTTYFCRDFHWKKY